MSCLCGSSKCDCEEECFCPEALCGCPMCKLLPKMCPHCSLPYDSSKGYACQVCSCGKEGDSSYSEAMSGSQTTESETSCDSKVPVCHCCQLPIFLVDTGDDEQKHKDNCCRCPQKNRIANEPILSEHETSTSTSDHRQVSADRQVRKALSRKTRTEKSNWQAKKAKDRSSNSPEEAGNNTETVSAGTLLTDTSSSHLEGQDSYSACATYASNTDNINPDFNSPQKLSSRTDETTAGNTSLLVNISGVSSQFTPEASSSQTSGYKQANITGEVPPFPLLPNLIPVPPGFERQQDPLPIAVNLDNAPQPLPEQDPAAQRRTEKMEKWFGTIQDVLNTSGKLPDAETAAALDKLDQDNPDTGNPNTEKSEVDDSVEFPNYGSIPSPKGKRKGKSDTEQHTDTDRSTSVSQYPIESDHIESESD